jgi:hypothetical protein
MNSSKHYAEVETPVPGSEWTSLDEKQRISLILKKLEDSTLHFLDLMNVVAAKSDGQVIVQMKQDQAASKRGPFLLDLEAILKATIDDALCVWLEPLGDRNSLRNLRGIEVKAS